MVVWLVRNGFEALMMRVRYMVNTTTTKVHARAYSVLINSRALPPVCRDVDVGRCTSGTSPVGFPFCVTVKLIVGSPEKENASELVTSGRPDSVTPPVAVRVDDLPVVRPVTVVPVALTLVSSLSAVLLALGTNVSLCPAHASRMLFGTGAMLYPEALHSALSAVLFPMNSCPYAFSQSSQLIPPKSALHGRRRWRFTQVTHACFTASQPDSQWHSSKAVKFTGAPATSSQCGSMRSWKSA